MQTALIAYNPVTPYTIIAVDGSQIFENLKPVDCPIDQCEIMDPAS